MAIITANRYNTIRQQVNTVLGNGSGDTGYGQILNAQNVAVGALIQADNINNLYEDIRKAYKHQTGGNPGSTLLQTVTTNDLIKSDDQVEYKGWTQYEALASLIQTNRFDVDPNQQDVAQAYTKTRSSWNGTITSITDVQFNSADARRHFFNQGGFIRITASVADSSSKGSDWNSILSGAGNVDLKAHGTTSSGGSGTVSSAIGNYELTASNQYLYQNFDAGSGAYSANDYYIEALSSGNTITITQTFRDQAGGNPDEAIADATATIFTGTAITDVIGTAPTVIVNPGSTF